MRVGPLPVKYLVGGGLVAVVAISAFLDDLLEGRPLRGPDFLLGALLGAITLAALVILERIGSSRRRQADIAHRRRQAMQSLRTLGGGDELAALLDRLVDCADDLLRPDATIAIASDRQAPAEMFVVAASGAGSPAIGTRVPNGPGVAAAVLDGGGPILLHDPRSNPSLAADRLLGGAWSVAAAPISWGGQIRGVLAASSNRRGRRMAENELEIVAELAEGSGVALEQVDLRERAQQSLAAYVEAFALALDARDQYTGSHCDQVVELCNGVGTRLGLSQDELRELELAARMHDIGKLGVPDAILNKQGPLDDAEWKVMCEHPVWGAELLEQVPELGEVAGIVRAAHEHWDGGGYPDGLAGQQIPRSSRIVLACDAFHAMTSNRPYCAGISSAQARDELRANAGTQFDPEVVVALTELLDEGAVETGAAERPGSRRPAA